uniref:hypothetical protein n=1 Tax=Porodaedalea mongolica TaxID=2651638 RepID=UPI0021ABDEF3|nr:hypothetical protein NYK79_mgp08 [Porodaedalea mongolica]UUA03982.1 hypothetical protein [Porodaedalea mongolica]WCF76751.1 hypothetical protein [Porodaedalea mongolica]
MALDVETYLDAENKMSIYCISVFDGDKSKSFYLTDYKNIDSLIKDLLSTIFNRKYSGKKIYIHNSSEFDLIFLLKYIVSYGSVKVEPIIKDGKFISIDIRFGPYFMYNVLFRDSILLLPDSLAKLGKAFKLDNVKDLFPHKFVTKDNLNYKGTVPTFDFFDTSKVSKDEYLSYCSRFPNNDWSLKNEAIKYCELDCKSLYEVIMSFSNQIFKEFKVNTSTTPPNGVTITRQVLHLKYLGHSLYLQVLKSLRSQVKYSRI